MLANDASVAGVLPGGLGGVLRVYGSLCTPFTARRFALAVALVTLTAVLAVAGPILLKFLVDGLASNPGPFAGLTAAALCLAYVATHVIGRSFGELRALLHGQAEQDLLRRLSQRLFRQLMSLPLRFHLERKSGGITQLLTSALIGTQLILQQLLYTVLPALIELAGVAVVLLQFRRSEYLLILLMSALAYAAILARSTVRVGGMARAVSGASIESHAILADTLMNYEPIKCFNAEAATLKRYEGSLESSQHHWQRLYRTQATSGIALVAVFGTSLGISLLMAVREVVRGTMTVGDLVLVNTYVLQIARPLESVGRAVRSIAQGLAYLEKMLDLLRASPEPSRADTCVMGSRSVAALQFDDVCFSYDGRRRVINNLSFRVLTGRTVGIVGPSGSGKSSIVRLLLRLCEQDSGCILFHGVPITELPPATLRDSIGVVLQDTVLFNGTIADNIAIGRDGYSQAEIEEAARFARLHDCVMALPDRYQTVVGERGVKLSAGERQRIAIARAALKRPGLFVFDEATSALDSVAEGAVLANLRQIAASNTTLIISHRLTAVAHADEIYVLDDGAVVERGTHEQLLARHERYAELWNAQQADASGCRGTRAAC